MSKNLNSIKFPSPEIISVNGIQLEIFEAGKGNKGMPVVLCHGFPENAFSWRYQIFELEKAGYHVIAPNQRGYGYSSCPKEIIEYDIAHLTGDLIAILDYYGYNKATFIGHDWGSNIVWNLALLHPERVNKIINLALPYQVRGEKPWIEWMEEVFGADNYFVHFNRQIGVADAILNENKHQFLSNLFRKNIPPTIPKLGMLMIDLAKAEKPFGEPIMSEDELAVYVSAFEHSGFTGGINWYRNLDRNWYLLADVNPIIQHPTLMIYGKQDMIPQFENLKDFVPKVEVKSLDCGHYIQQEKSEEVTREILKWLKEKNSIKTYI